jgi:hypothetical protein
MNNSILNIKVSSFENCKSISPKDVNLLSWLTSDKYRDKVMGLRNIQDENIQKVIKASLPAITPSGTFSTRSEKGLIAHSGFLAFDIDFKDNQHIDNFNDLKRQVSNIINVAYCGLSVRGHGYWGLIFVPKSTPAEHKQRFNALAKDFKSFGIILDPSGSDVCRLRIYSYDPEAYFNHSAKPYTKILKPQPKRLSRPALTDTREKVEAVISQIKQNKIDITQSYDEWLKVGYTFSNEFGEAGRGYFHAVSQYHSDYSIQETDKMFDNVTKHNKGKSNIGLFFKIASDYGIKQISENVPSTIRLSNLSTPEIYISELRNAELTPIKTIKSGPWSNEIDELEKCFQVLPAGLVRLNQYELITDPSLFVKSHLDIVKGQNGNDRYKPYLDRLKELKRILSN